MYDWLICTAVIGLVLLLIGYFWGKRNGRGKEENIFQSEETREYFFLKHLKERERNQEIIANLRNQNEELLHKIKVRDRLIDRMYMKDADKLCAEIFQKKKKK